MQLGFVLGFVGFVKKLPIIRSIPGFNTLPSQINEKNLRFYKLSNLVLTLGMFVHALWVFLFWMLEINTMFWINIGSVFIYIFSIVINRKGYYFTSSVIMVSEIIAHQYFAIETFGLNAGFQYYIIVIGLFPFLMPQGKWILKSFMLALCLLGFILFDYLFKDAIPKEKITEAFLVFFRISNIIFSFTSLGICGAYFNLAMHETENLLENKTQLLQLEKNKTDELLLNILPFETAEELKETGRTQPKYFKDVTVLFTDFKNFTQISETLEAEKLVEEIHFYYCEFDRIMNRNNIEKIKTIGDSYMAVGGLPTENNSHPIDAVNAAFEIKKFIEKEKVERQNRQLPYFDIRIGIHTGNVVAGIVGTKKFAYDVWGDTVNIASRMESTCLPGHINISGATFEHIQNYFKCSYRGKVLAKNKGEIDMYFVDEKLT